MTSCLVNASSNFMSGWSSTLSIFVSLPIWILMVILHNLWKQMEWWLMQWRLDTHIAVSRNQHIHKVCLIAHCLHSTTKWMTYMHWDRFLENRRGDTTAFRDQCGTCPCKVKVGFILSSHSIICHLKDKRQCIFVFIWSLRKEDLPFQNQNGAHTALQHHNWPPMKSRIQCRMRKKEDDLPVFMYPYL